jgi:formylglycine-generating enzyme required for sulfatase activity
VQVAFEDAAAYAAWACKDLPTEAEWEFAARGGLDGTIFCWGNEFMTGGQYMANTWQGQFPLRDLGADGFIGRAPVGSFPPNSYGLYDMAGNVWEWTSDWYFDQHPPEAEGSCCVPRDPRGGAEALSYDPMQPEIRIPRKVIKGGSYLCAPNYCRRYRPAARHPQMIDTGTCHIGFRCVRRANANQERAAVSRRQLFCPPRQHRRPPSVDRGVSTGHGINTGSRCSYRASCQPVVRMPDNQSGSSLSEAV